MSNQMPCLRSSLLELQNWSAWGGSRELEMRYKGKKKKKISVRYYSAILEQEMGTHSSILAWGNLMDRGAWWATVHGVTRESDMTE